MKLIKIYSQNSLNPPYGNIISIHEGETGLPHKIFYNLETNNKIINSYNMLLRDFALNMGVVGEESELFADGIFHYEKRIVNQILLTEKSTNSDVMVVKKLGELKKIAPSLPIFETVQAIFSKTKITEETEVLVQNSNILQAMSIIISTSDKQPLNDFIIWAMARKLLPYLSREYNVLVDKYEQALYGFKSVTPKWYFCTAAVRNMMLFAVDALQENSTLISEAPPQGNSKQKLLFGDELFKLMFYHIRNEVQMFLKNAAEMSESNRTNIIEKLSNIKLQIGLPDVALQNSTYIQEYYEDFLLQNLFFAEHLESFWNFRKVRMEKSLKPPRLVDLIIAELYSNEKHQRIAFSPSINMAIVSRRLLRPRYFDYKYPISFNFARVGSDIAEFFLDAISLYLTQEQQITNIPLKDIFHIKCLKGQLIEQNTTLPSEAGSKLYNKVIAAKITFSALNSFIHTVRKSEPILGAPISEVTYADLGLTKDMRQPGLRYLFEQQHFALAVLQNHCSVSDETFSKFKPFIQNEISESKTFFTLWNYVPYLSNSFYCSPERSKCFKIF